MNHTQDTPSEKRVVELRAIHLQKPSEELAFLEEYVKWKNDDGPARLEAKMQKERTAHDRREKR